ncbi:biopolymer transport protein ExbD [Planctomycetes bacterium Poly30]|uniref:Biopolymer transport protein ExbD n=1 Tax=Saltatorellus ferox TaxID=2528018 RepID=A0A518EVX4_9BACT|nr:biopolymer transport protein ExbD [Planctomycetes bacterium Poly30]
MNLAKHDANTDMEMDMTPMIDVVFLLIIFFMIITDLTQQELEDVDLPTAEHAKPDQPDPEEWRPIINVTYRGEMIIKKKVQYDPDLPEFQGKNKFAELKTWLLSAANRMKKEPLSPGSSKLVPDEPVLIRADMTTPFKYVQDIMEQCGDQAISIWKLQLAVSTPEGADETNE